MGPCELVVLKHNTNGQLDVCRGTYMRSLGQIIHCTWGAHVRQTWCSRDGGGHLVQHLTHWQRMEPGADVDSEIVVDCGWYQSFDDTSMDDVQFLGIEV